MLSIEKRVKVTSWRCEFSLFVHQARYERFRCEIAWIHTGHDVHLITFDCEGLEETFCYGGDLSQVEIMDLVQSKAQELLHADQELWEAESD